MDIDNSNTTAAHIGSRDPAKKAQVHQQVVQHARHVKHVKAVHQNAPADKATLTEDANLMQRIEKKLSSLPIVDNGRVERIQNALESDSFQINPAIVAKKLFNLERSLHHASA